MSRETSTDALRAYFERFGEIKDAVVKMDPATGQSRGFGFILFCNEASIEAVLAAGAHEIDGKSVSRLLLIYSLKIISILGWSKKAEPNVCLRM